MKLVNRFVASDKSPPVSRTLNAEPSPLRPYSTPGPVHPDRALGRQAMQDKEQPGALAPRYHWSSAAYTNIWSPAYRGAR